MNKIAVVCASGIGDGLLMQIAAKQLRGLGLEVTLFSQWLHELAEWFPGFSFAKQPVVGCVAEALSEFDAVVLQHDNSAKAKEIKALGKPVYCLFGSHQVPKHGELNRERDYVFDSTICMAENISLAMQVLLGAEDFELANGLTPPPHLVPRKYHNRIAIHPTSTSPNKNWSKNSFLELRKEIEQEGWEPVFITPPSEAAMWGSPLLPSLADLAAFLYESQLLIGNDSGPGHLASNLGLKTVIIGPSREHLTFWRPGWCRGEIVHPPKWATTLKVTRPFWMNLVSVHHVVKAFTKLTDIK